MNQVRISAQLIERATLRYTPAGLPALDVRLAHASQVEHAGQMRKVDVEVHATVIGELARDLEMQAVGTAAVYTGFLGKQRNGRGLMLHIQAFDLCPSFRI